MKTSYPKNKIKVVLLEGVHPAGVASLRGEGFDVHSLPGSPDRAKLLRLVADAHVLGIRSKTDLPAEVLDASPRLLAVGCFCIGTNQVDLAHARSRGIPVFNAPFSNTRSVAELTIAEVIALHRRLTDKSAGLHAGRWDKSAAGAHEIRGRTLGIVGYGHIGSQVSVLAEALGMRVVYFDIVPKLPMGNARAVRSLGDLLKDADVVTLHVPATAQTENMIGASQIRRMKPGGFLINNARGGVVNIPALAAAIKSGHLGGAALDVFPLEPASKDEAFASEVQGLANVILTPHIGGSTEEAQETIAQDVCTKLLKFVNVGTTTGAVNVPEVELPGQGGGAGGGGGSGGGGGDDDSESGQRPGPRRHRILHFHKNVPGVLSTMHRVIAEQGANISAEYLRTSEDLGYVVLDVDPSNRGNILDELKRMPETVRVRVLW